MYKAFFGLKDNPFNVNPDPRYLFMTKEVEEALSSLMYGIQTRKGIITLTGEVGTGKTTLINRLLDWLRGQRAQDSVSVQLQDELDAAVRLRPGGI